MNNPYQSPIAEARTEELVAALAAIGPLKTMIQTLRIIVVALAIGVVVFAGYTIYANAGKPLALGTNLVGTIGLAMLGFGALQGVLGVVLPPLVFRNMPVQPAAAAHFAAHGPETAKILGIQQRIMTATIIGGAMLEGGAFANLVAFMMAQDLVNLAAAGVLLLGILMYFPLPGRCERKIAAELRRLKEDDSLRPAIRA
jgi:hypothetical protein